MQTSEDARFYAVSAKFPKKFSNAGKPVVIQLTVKHEQNIDCGGGYVKVYFVFKTKKNLKPKNLLKLKNIFLGYVF